MTQTRPVFFVSDGTGITAETLGEALLAQFEGVRFEYFSSPVEILAGPGSTLYGSDAIGGVIQIFTRHGERAVRRSRRAGID